MGQFFAPDKPDEAHFTCVACGCVIEEHIAPGCSPVSSGVRIIRAARRAPLVLDLVRLLIFAVLAADRARMARSRGDPASEKRFLERYARKAYEARRGPAARGAAARAAKSHYARGEVPKGALILTLGVDVAGFARRPLEWQLIGHGELLT